jgi:hypothetical protein
MAAATTTVNLVFGQWTQVTPLGDVAVVTPQVHDGKFIVRYASSQPAAGITVGHEYFRTDQEPNLMVGGHQTMAAWMRPIHPAQSVDVLVTRF